MTIRQLAREEVVTTDPEAPLSSVAELMRERCVGSVVVTEGDRPVGLVTDRDIGVEVWDHPDPTDLSAADVMTPDPITVEADTGVYESFRVVSDAAVRRLPVVDDGRLVGIVTLDDFVVLLAGELDGLASVVQAESPPY
jgi:CBS domain-containing protein